MSVFPSGEVLSATGNDARLFWTLLDRPERHDCRVLLKAQCSPKVPLRKIPRKCKARLGDWRRSDDELCEPAEVLRGCRQGELELGTAWSAQAQTTDGRSEMCKQHLNSFASAARAIECFGLSQRPGYVTGLLVDAARDSAQRRLRTALRLEEAAAAVACLVEKCIPIIDQLARRSENLAGRTNVNVLLLVKAEVLPTEGSIPPEYAAPYSYP